MTSRIVAAAPAASPPSHWADRFRLDGPTRPIDGRVNAVRADIADIALAGRLFAPHYAAPHARRCMVGSTMLTDAPDDRARVVSELLLGETFEIVDASGGWAWGYCRHDRYVGYVREDALGDAPEPDMMVTARHALVFAEPDIKAPVVAIWSLGARFAGTPDGNFIVTDRGYVHRRHAAPLSESTSDPVAVAEQLLGTPYCWGGRSADGIDCSGLVQLALARAGIAAPRDSDQQRDAIGEELAPDAALRRGDVIFFPGHVGLMVDDARLIHANAHAMATTIEPLADVTARLAADHPHPILSRRRFMA